MPRRKSEGWGGRGGGVRAATLEEDDSDNDAELQAALRQSLAESEPQRARGETKRPKVEQHQRCGMSGGEQAHGRRVIVDDSVICIEDQAGASAEKEKDAAKQSCVKIAPRRGSSSAHRTVLVVDSDSEGEGSSNPRDGRQEGCNGREDGRQEGCNGREDGARGVRSRGKRATHFRERLAGTDGNWDWLGFGGSGGRSEKRDWGGGMAQRDSAAAFDFGQWGDDAPVRQDAKVKDAVSKAAACFRIIASHECHVLKEATWVIPYARFWPFRVMPYALYFAIWFMPYVVFFCRDLLFSLLCRRPSFNPLSFLPSEVKSQSIGRKAHASTRNRWRSIARRMRR